MATTPDRFHHIRWVDVALVLLCLAVVVHAARAEQPHACSAPAADTRLVPAPQNLIFHQPLSPQPEEGNRV